MRLGALRFSLIVALAAPGCGYATAPTQSTTFALDAGNYTLKISGSGTCSNGTLEGVSPVTVARSGTSWSVRSLQASDTFTMSLTTDAVPAGSARGDVAGTLSAAGPTINANGAITGNNSAANIAGGPITNPSGGIIFVVTFGSIGGCTAGTWTLTPR